MSYFKEYSIGCIPKTKNITLSRSVLSPPVGPISAGLLTTSLVSVAGCRITVRKKIQELFHLCQVSTNVCTMIMSRSRSINMVEKAVIVACLGVILLHVKASEYRLNFVTDL